MGGQCSLLVHGHALEQGRAAAEKHAAAILADPALVSSLPCHHTGLQSLRVGTNNLRSLPPELAWAVRLTQLDIAHNAMLQLTCADIDCLARLPHLRELRHCGVPASAEVHKYARAVLNEWDD